MEFKVIVGWDEDAQVFMVVESDIEGLWLEDATFEGLMAKVKDVAPELIQHNHQGADGSLRIFRQVGAPVPLTHAT